jgi:hypothetical protein
MSASVRGESSASRRIVAPTPGFMIFSLGPADDAITAGRYRMRIANSFYEAEIGALC